MGLQEIIMKNRADLQGIIGDDRRDLQGIIEGREGIIERMYKK